MGAMTAETAAPFILSDVAYSSGHLRSKIGAVPCYNTLRSSIPVCAQFSWKVPDTWLSAFWQATRLVYKVELFETGTGN